MRKKKRANAVLDTTVILVVIIVAAFVLMITQGIKKDVNDAVQADDEMGAAAKAISQEEVNDSTLWDWVGFLLIMFLFAGALVASFYIDASPVFLIATIMGLAVVLIVAINLEQSYNSMVDDADYSSFPTDFPKMAWIIDHILPLLIVFGFAVAGVSYTRLA